MIRYLFRICLMYRLNFDPYCVIGVLVHKLRYIQVSKYMIILSRMFEFYLSTVWCYGRCRWYMICSTFNMLNNWTIKQQVDQFTLLFICIVSTWHRWYRIGVAVYSWFFFFLFVSFFYVRLFINNYLWMKCYVQIFAIDKQFIQKFTLCVCRRFSY